MRQLVIFIFLLTICISPASAQGDKIAAQKKIIANLEKQVAEGEKQMLNIRRDRADKQTRVSSLASQIESRGRLLKAQTTQINLLKVEISENNLRADSLSAVLKREKDLYAEMVREAYRNYNNNNLMSYIFTSESFTDVARKVVNLRAISQYRESRMDRIKTLDNELIEHRRILTEQKESLDRTLAELKSQKANLERDQQTAKLAIKSMSAKEKKLLQDRELQKKKLDSAIAELRKLSRGNTTGASFSTKTTNLNLPVVGGRVKRYMENMAEITGAENAKIISIYEGRVVDIKYNRITGKYDVYIAHGEYITSYAGLSKVNVVKSSTVVKNQVIGIIGAAVDILTMQTEYKIVFGIYPPNPTQKMRAAECFKRK